MIKNWEHTYTLSNGNKIPCIAFGTWFENPEIDAERSIQHALEAGYRFFDTASIYGTERYLGTALKNSGVKREEFFIESKLWIDEMGYSETKAALDRTLDRLQLDYLDMYFIHWPRQPRGEGFSKWKELDIETWTALEEAHRAGKVKNLGVSNFLPHHLENLLQNCEIRPCVDQLELHLLYLQEAAIEYCRQNGIILEAWAPLGRRNVFTQPIVEEMAEKYGVSSARICIRYLVQRGIIPLIKSTNPQRITENADVFSFEISQEDMMLLTSLPNIAWVNEHPDIAIPDIGSDKINGGMLVNPFATK